MEKAIQSVKKKHNKTLDGFAKKRKEEMEKLDREIAPNSAKRKTWNQAFNNLR
jgi:hypothetical protein